MGLGIILLLKIFTLTALSSCPGDLSTRHVLKVALVQYEMTRPRSLESWETKLHALVKEAATGGAQVILFPELIALEGLSLLDPQAKKLDESTRKLATEYTPHFQKHFAFWAKEYAVTIIGGTWPSLQNEKVFNTAFAFGPDGNLLSCQNKNHLTAGEVEHYKFTGATGEAVVFKLPGGIDAAIAICFDVEFPNFLPAVSGTIPEVIFVPSQTGDDNGRFRVARTASARAVEYHAYVLVTGTVAGIDSDPILGASRGQAKVFSPSDKAFPHHGVLAKGPLNQASIVFAELDLTTLRRSRKESTTFPAKILHDPR